MSTVVIATNQFKREVKKILTAKDIDEIASHLQINPEAGDIVQGTGGVRKLRWVNPKNNKGKSGGLRILYYYNGDILILLLSAYSKSDSENVSEAERNRLKEIVPVLTKEAMEDLE